MDPAPVVAASSAGPVAHESRIAGHLAWHALVVAPAVILVAGLLRGVDGAASAAIGLVLVALNFLVSARMIAWAAAKSPAFVQGAVLGGFVIRLAALMGIVLLLEQVAFVDVAVLVITIAVTHLALLVWETRSVSLTLAAPGLKPGVGPGVGRRDPREKE